MSESKHTKGPWQYRRDGDYFTVGPFEGKDNGEGNEADYRLVAAAPTMLAALERAAVSLGWLAHGAPDDLLSQIEAAIAEAKKE